MKIKLGIGHCWIFFENGYTLSIINGFGSYSENHDNFEKEWQITDHRDILANWESSDVEIAIIKDGKFVTSDVLDNNYDVEGYVKVEELTEIIEKIKEM